MSVKFKQPDAPQHSFEVYEPGASYPNYPEPAVVDLDLKKIDSMLSKALFGYVGTDGSDGKEEKHARVLSMISSGIEIEMPIMSAAQSDTTEKFKRSMKVRDGRHRLWNLNNLGHERVLVVVPKFQAELFTQFFD